MLREIVRDLGEVFVFALSALLHHLGDRVFQPVRFCP